MKGVKITRIGQTESAEKALHEGFAYRKHKLLDEGEAEQCVISAYEVPPGKAAYPYHYHYHLKNEETFYILSGEGLLRTPEGERKVGAGDFLFFPANEMGAHQLRNISETEMLWYLDFDTKNDLDVCYYPDSHKVGIIVGDVEENSFFLTKDQVDYYHGE